MFFFNFHLKNKFKLGSLRLKLSSIIPVSASARRININRDQNMEEQYAIVRGGILNPT